MIEQYIADFLNTWPYWVVRARCVQEKYSDFIILLRNTHTRDLLTKKLPNFWVDNQTQVFMKPWDKTHSLAFNPKIYRPVLQELQTWYEEPTDTTHVWSVAEIIVRRKIFGKI